MQIIFIILVILLGILVFMSVGNKDEKDLHTVYFLVALSLFGVFIWTAPRLPQVLAEESGATLWKHITLYIIFLVILIWYIVAMVIKYHTSKFPYFKTS